jgi:hypothetical protein
VCVSRDELQLGKLLGRSYFYSLIPELCTE